MDITQLVLAHLPAKKRRRTSGISFNCPMCVQQGESRPDTRMRGGLKVDPSGSFVYHCFNCKFATKWEVNGRISKNLMRFLTALGIPETQIPIRLRLLKPKEKITQHINIEPLKLEFNEKSLPRGAKSFEEWYKSENIPNLFVDAVSYMHSRGDAVFNGWQYYWTPDTVYSMNQRVIIPFWHKKKIVGFAARRFTSNSKLSKYHGFTPKDYMFNQELLEKDEVIFLVEGVLDAIAIGGVAVLGNSISENQEKLLQRSNKRIILIPDKNRAGATLLKQAIKNGWDIATPQWGIGVDDCAFATSRFGKLFTVKSILDSVVPGNSLKASIAVSL